MNLSDPNLSQKSPFIVVIDDDASMRQALDRLITSLGHSVLTYASANEFLRSSHFEDTVCMILDIQMPGLSGLDLQNVVVAMRSPIPIIFITAHRDEDARARAFKMGAAGFLEKPFDEQSLIDLLEKVMPRAPSEDIFR